MWACQSCAKGFVLPDSDVAFSAAGTVRFWSVFGWFGAAVPLRFAVLRGRLRGLALGPSKPSPAQVGLAKLCQRLFLTGFRCCVLGRSSARPRPVQPGPAQACKPWQSSAKGFFLPDSDAPFSAAGTLRFSSVFGLFGAAVSPFWRVGSGASLLVPAQPSPVSLAQPTQPTAQLSPAPSPAQPSQAIHPAQALVWALPKLCQRLFLTGFRCCVPLRSPF